MVLANSTAPHRPMKLWIQWLCHQRLTKIRLKLFCHSYYQIHSKIQGILCLWVLFYKWIHIPLFGFNSELLIFLQNPINADEHYVLDFTLTIPLVVYESEPSSIIACALSSNQYLHLLEECVARVAANSESTSKFVPTNSFL